MRCQTTNKRDWSPYKIVFFEVATKILPSGNNPNKCHGKVLSLQPMIPPKRSDFSLDNKTRSRSGHLIYFGSSRMYGHPYIKGKDQPGKVVNPARGQLNREIVFFPVRVRA